MLLQVKRPSNTIIGAIVITIALVFLIFGQRLEGIHTGGFIGSQGKEKNHGQEDAVKRDLVEDVYNSTFGFDKIYVVSLASRTDRRDSMVLSAALSNINVDFIDGVKGEDMNEKAMPPGDKWKEMSKSQLGSWRAHINALHEIVRLNLSSALILEDDADWDIRIKDQLHSLALSTNALTQPLLSSPSTYADPTFPTPPTPSLMPRDIEYNKLPVTVPPTLNPYGDHWDVMWLGHCRMSFPSPNGPSPSLIPKGRIYHRNDESVPAQKYLPDSYGNTELRDEYPAHTRIIHHVSFGLCSLAYAVSQAGARKLLYDIGIENLDEPFDVLLHQACDGSNGKNYHVCLTSQPGLFQHHRPRGNMDAESDISGHGNDFREKAKTDLIRWSVRLNWNTLLKGAKVFEDQLPDEEEVVE
ncbi:hypothetical protein B7494_g2461 [Chlorociboria aeruginascens]|nr:hypothetical protein B7494_g2461 [Chlorociboria aeruginascens]